MFEGKEFSLDTVLASLDQLRIPYRVSTPHSERGYSFKSLREIGDYGIFFFVGGFKNKPLIKNSIILCVENDYGCEGNITIAVEDPQLVFYKLSALLLTDKKKKSGIHETAIVDPNAIISPDAYIGPYCVVENCEIKSGVRLHSHVTIMSGTTIEEDVVVEPHSTIGATGVAWIWDPETRERVIQPQTGYTLIGRGSFLGSDISVVRGSINESTVIGRGCVIAHGSKIGHGAKVGDECHFANNVSIAGNVTLGNQCFLGSGAVVRPQTKLAECTVVGAGAVVVKDCEEKGCLLMGVPAKRSTPDQTRLSGVPKQLD
ncbi:hypothetical protein [Marinobacterium rhizophilum]|uniref:UDP-3-O-[3-hydroxymyristoyl] glucosamine N-acyltransferase n=1 Tax=Marinobacterium rhizophilum TaxID=420402 RepID=A0ABY5HKW4_9GAMM|nr:hypothetical protein [Marinobacterium rhizophilum]UTW12940.1 hypothetical protein KDW95_04500 [Marinobacterium rhizophilum]